MKIQVIGIPSNAGALYEGTELAPQMLRQAGLITALTEKGFSVEDKGDLLSTVILPRHNNSPVRNWPAPRLVWEEIYENASNIFHPHTFSVILGGDCSIEVGTFSAFRKVYGSNSHLLVIDGHVDTLQPKEDACMGAAGMGLWFLLDQEGKWWNNEPICPRDISIIGANHNSENECDIHVVSYDALTHGAFENIVKNHLASIRQDSILVHLDVDVLKNDIMPAAYSPSEIGLDMVKARLLLREILSDTRVKAIEVTEYSANKDIDFQSAKVIIELISQMQTRA
jgi:arginase